MVEPVANRPPEESRGTPSTVSQRSTNAHPRRLRLAVLISGGGTTLKNLLRVHDAGQLDVDFALVISSTAHAKGLEFARAAQIPTAVHVRRSSLTDAEYADLIFGACRQASADLVVMAGFLKYVPIPDDYQNRVLNIHPSLIPAFCGHGYYGHHVHAAVLEYGAKIGGCTVHFVDNQYDHGPIILQRTVPVLDDDTPDTLAARVFAEECSAYPAAIRSFAAGELHVVGRRVIKRDA